MLSGHLNVLDIQSSFHSAANDSDIDRQVAAWLLSGLEKRNKQNLFEFSLKVCISSSQLTAPVQKRKGKNVFIPGLELRVGKGDNVS